eukprot:4751426-Alexandrium_andersonii.AAC.1
MGGGSPRRTGGSTTVPWRASPAEAETKSSASSPKPSGAAITADDDSGQMPSAPKGIGSALCASPKVST